MALRVPVPAVRARALPRPTSGALGAGAVVLVVLLACAAYLVTNDLLSRRAPAYADSWASAAGSVAVALLVTVPALVVVGARPRNPIGWLLTAEVLLDLGGEVTAQLALLDLHAPGGDVQAGRWWAAASEASQRPAFLLPLLILALFPTGRPLSPAWRWLPRAVSCLAVVWFVAHLAGPTLDEPPFAGQATGWQPGGLVGAVLDARVYLPAAGLLAIATLVGVAARSRASRGVERQQLKWLALPLALAPLAMVALAVAGWVGPRAMNAAGDLLWVSAALVLPACVAVAISRYRLYDLDLVVNRTIVYGGLCVVLAAAYAGTVVLATDLVSRGSDASSPVVVALATLAAAALLMPARSQLQGLVDRTFSRRAWTAERVLGRAVDQARHQRLDAVGLQHALREALGDHDATLGLWLRSRGALVGADGSSLGPAADGRHDLVLGTPDGDEPGPALVRVGPDTARDHRLLATVAAASALAAENVRLRVELDDRVAEVERSRARLLAESDETRRRIERDLHDGAQQHLVGLALHVRLAARETSDPLLDMIEHELRQATEELRELARGLHPAALEEGLEPALRVVVARLPVPVRLDVEPVRLGRAAELAGYYVACEAITNACRHAAAGRIDVTGRPEPGGFRLSVEDDGRGGADEARGSGLAGLRDRAGAVGGRLAVAGRPGGGTVVSVWLPCG